MKKKCFIIAISLIAVIVIGIIFFPVLRELKWKHEHSMIESKVNKAFEEMIVFCEEHQKELGVYSSRYIATKHPDMSYKQLKRLERKVADDLDYIWLFDYISIGYTGEWEKEEGVILYRYKEEYLDYKYGIVEVLYINKEMSEKEVEEMDFFGDPHFLEDINQINTHLYVFMRGYEDV
ncbi:MAG: hypothetical protein HDR22_06155 [Lachnospiraceae bacterium]|nr:hypothetical protein [Lachnospiraceae bacterium]